MLLNSHGTWVRLELISAILPIRADLGRPSEDDRLGAKNVDGTELVVQCAGLRSEKQRKKVF